MDLYHSWIYENILNTKWFVWTIVIGVFTFNFLGPILVWFVMNSKSIPFLHKLVRRKKTEAN